VLVCVWRGDLGQAVLPLPDERLDLVWVDGGTLWLSGPETTSWSRGYPLAEPAATAGYSDQQHLAHEVRAIMGTTPTRLLRSADV
jgi:AraC-like DNA-binding protein